MSYIPLTSAWEKPVKAGPKLEIGRAVPRAVRQQVYQLELTIKESDAEIRKILASYGLDKRAIRYQRSRIIRERG